MSKIFIQTDHANFDSFLEYAKEQGYSMEIASFAFSNILDTDWQTILLEYQLKLEDFKGIISLHGAFQDLILHSRDSKIRNASRGRIIQNLDIARVLNTTYIVFHGNFNPLIKHKSYEENWVEQNAAFWSETLSKYDMTILIENVWEETPDIFKRLLDKVKSSRLKICYDTGHSNIFSKVYFDMWLDVLGKDISYIHVNDNRGDVDNKLVPGEGTINWQKFSDKIEKYDIAPDIVFEVGTLEKTIQSIMYFKENKIYPFN